MTTSPLPGGLAPAQPRKSGCGARGCLFGCLTLIAIPVIGFLVARPLLQEQWSRWREENPWVAQVPGVAAVLRDVAGEMGGGPEAVGDVAAGDTAGGGDPSGRRREGVDDKTAMPADLPIWPRPMAETFSVGDEHAAAYQRVNQQPDSVLRFFRRALPAAGWRLEKERAGAGGVLLLYRKGGRIVRVEVVADTAGADIWVRSRSVSPAGTR